MILNKNQIVTFLLSMSSMSYQFLLGTVISTYLGGDLFIFPIITGLFILGMSYGSSKLNLTNLFVLEFKIIIFAIIAFLSIFFLYNVEEFPYYSLITSLFSALIIGFFTGQELPILLKKDNKKNILFFDYLASFISSILFIKVFTVYFKFVQILFIIIFINILAVFILYELNIFLLGIFTIILPIHINKIENFLIRKNFNIMSEEIIVINKKTKFAKIIGLEQNEHLRLYLNNSIQFYDKYKNKNNIYHKTLTYPIQIFKERIKNVLILGGGDGLPSKYIQEINLNINQTLIDIDKEWLHLNKNNKKLIKMNNNSLNHSNVKIKTMNAFEFIKNNNFKFDVIIIDFPEFESLESLRIHSKKFLNELNKSLTNNGFIIYQEDKKEKQNVKDSIKYTAYKNNFFPLEGSFINNKKNRSITQYLLFKNRNDSLYFLEKEELSLIKYNNHINNKTKETTYFEPYIMRLRLLNFLKGLIYE